MKEIVTFSEGVLGESLGAVRPGWLAGWPAAGWLADWLADWLAGWPAGWLAGWLAGCDTTKMLIFYREYEDSQ